jgi:hypothetical protein
VYSSAVSGIAVVTTVVETSFVDEDNARHLGATERATERRRAAA